MHDAGNSLVKTRLLFQQQLELISVCFNSIRRSITCGEISSSAAVAPHVAQFLSK
jgi:hypothetical protein